MAPLADATRQTAYRNALANWRFEGYVTWKEIAAEWVHRELQGFTTVAVAQRMHEFVEAGGVVDEVVESRPEWQEYERHYDLRFTIGERRIYIETLLFFDNPNDPDDPWIKVVSIHDQ